jgi:trigger factor
VKKHFLALLLGISLAAATITGCSTNKTTTTSNSSEELSAFSYEPSEYITLGDYTGLTLDSPKTEVTDEVLEAQIEQNMQDNPIVHTVTDRQPKEDDYVVIDFSSTLDGEDYDDASEDYELIVGGEELGSEVDEALKKASVGDTFTVSHVLSEDYGDDAGKTVEYTVQLKEIREYEEVSELTDDYVQTTFNCDSVEAYKESVKSQLLEELEETNQQTVISNALDMILENSEIKDYPEELYEFYDEQIRSMYEYFASTFGMEVSDIVSDEELESTVEDNVKISLVTNAIAKKENLTITEDAYQTYLEENLDTDTYSSVEEFEEDYGKQSLLEEMQAQLVDEFLLSNNTLNEMSQEEFDNLYGETEEVEEE